MATLSSRLPEIAAELRPKVSRAVKETADRIADDAKGRAPVQTGELRDSIHVQRVEAAEYVVVADAFYGALVEFGTSHTGARPFMVPAAESNRDTAKRLVSDALKGL